MKKTIPFILVLSLVPWGLTGCASTLSVKTVEPTETVQQSEKEALIFGKIIFVENGEEKIPYGIFRKPALTLFHDESGKEKVVTLVRDGTFYWIVPRGTYRIRDIGYNRCDYIIYPELTFSTFSEGNAFYLGTLRMDVDIKRFLWSVWIKQINSIGIIDEFDVAKEVLVASSEVQKSLMIPGKFHSMKSIYCNHFSGFSGFSAGFGGIGNLSGLGGLR